jgi:SAM-dependent methyltransferase
MRKLRVILPALGSLVSPPRRNGTVLLKSLVTRRLERAARQAPRWTAFPLLQDPAPCPICASDRLLPLHVYPNSKQTASPRTIKLALIGCETCGIVFSHPLPPSAELDAYYSSESGWQSRIAVNDAANSRILEYKRTLYAHDLPAIERFVGTGGSRPRKVFDFGCGLGAWLDILRARGWDTYGLEPGRRARAVAAHEHRMLTRIPDEPQFDLVILHHVLEHLRDPLAVTSALAAATKPGGHIYVSVPDFGRLHEHREFGYVKSGVHIFSYTSSSLRSLFALAGFELVAHSNESAWQSAAEGVDGRSITRLKAIGVPRSRELSLAPEPLTEALSSMRDYELHEAEKLYAKKKRRPLEQRKRDRDEKQRKPGRPGRSRHRVARRLRHLFPGWLRAAVRDRVELVRGRKPKSL